MDNYEKFVYATIRDKALCEAIVEGYRSFRAEEAKQGMLVGKVRAINEAEANQSMQSRNDYNLNDWQDGRTQPKAQAGNGNGNGNYGGNTFGSGPDAFSMGNALNKYPSSASKNSQQAGQAAVAARGGNRAPGRGPAGTGNGVTAPARMANNAGSKAQYAASGKTPGDRADNRMSVSAGDQWARWNSAMNPKKSGYELYQQQMAEQANKNRQVATNQNNGGNRGAAPATRATGAATGPHDVGCKGSGKAPRKVAANLGKKPVQKHQNAQVAAGNQGQAPYKESSNVASANNARQAYGELVEKFRAKYGKEPTENQKVRLQQMAVKKGASQFRQDYGQQNANPGSKMYGERAVRGSGTQTATMQNFRNKMKGSFDAADALINRKSNMA